MFHHATKLVIITENFVSQKVCNTIDRAGGKGYTLVPVGGKGAHHIHPTSDKATVVEDFANIKIEVVCHERSKAEAIAEDILTHCFDEYPGIIYLENVEICRPERF
jgi:nitrogen regulatory protein PII